MAVTLKKNETIYSSTSDYLAWSAGKGESLYYDTAYYYRGYGTSIVFDWMKFKNNKNAGYNSGASIELPAGTYVAFPSEYSGTGYNPLTHIYYCETTCDWLLDISDNPTGEQYGSATFLYLRSGRATRCTLSFSASKLSDIPVGCYVYLPTKTGSSRDYIYRVVHQGLPSSDYDASCNGTWLLREYLTGNPNGSCTWTSKVNAVAPSDLIDASIDAALKSTLTDACYKNLLTVKLPYFVGVNTDGRWVGQVKKGANGYTTKAFAPSTIELGGTSSSEVPAVGAKLDYFYEGYIYGNLDGQIRRLSYYDGSSSSVPGFWTRDPYASSSRNNYANAVNNQGNLTTYIISNTALKYPVMCLLQSDRKIVSKNGWYEFVPNLAPATPANITIPDSVRGGTDCKISWSEATDPDGNLDGYIVERSYNGGSSWAQIYQGRSTSTTTTIPFGTQTVMFRVCAYDTYGEKSGWRTSANKTVVNNRAPAAPPSISVPLSPAGGDKLTITWTASTDVDGNLEGYELERQWDGAGAFTQIYKGAALSFQDDIPKGEHTSVVYRVRAYDSFAAYSSYTTSPGRTIDNNTAPVISCDLSGDLGEKSEGFSIPYTVSDAEQQEVTVVERVGDLVKRTYKATLNEQATFEITGEYFQRILNGQQTVQIVATDSAGKSSTLSLTFTKKVHKAVITLSEPLAVEEQITVAVLAITGKIPADATQLVELTNNGNDAEPVWEDATADVKAGRNYVFKNKSQTAGWAFNFRMTVERGESGEDGNIVSIQGGFQ